MSNLQDAWNKQSSLRKQYIWGKNRLGYNSLDRTNQINTEDFKKSFDIAYDKKGSKFRDVGLSYRINPLTGEKEMFVAGSQGLLDWVFNATNAISYGLDKYVSKNVNKQLKKVGIKKQLPKLYKINLDRRRQQKGIARMARKHKVDTMYGHSRGGALVADTDFSGMKYGLDAAMILAENTNMTNYRRPGPFDAVLGLSGMDNQIVNSGRSIHWAYGS